MDIFLNSLMKMDRHAVQLSGYLIILVYLIFTPGCSGLLKSGKSDVRPTAILFSSTVEGNWDICRFDIDSKALKNLTQTVRVHERFPCWNPISRSVIYCMDSSELIEFCRDGSTKTIVDGPQAVTYTNPRVSPDGQYLAYVIYTIQGITEDGDIYILDMRTGKSRLLVNLPGHQFNPVWSHDGYCLAFMSGERRGAYDIWLVRRDGSEPRVVVKSDYFDNQPDLSPSGKQIVFTSNRTGDCEIWLCDLETNNLTQLTSRMGADEYPRWSPDGSQILFTSYRQGHFQIWVMNADGTKQRPLITGDFDARDGEWVF